MHAKRIARASRFALPLALLGACRAVGPDYAPPETPVPDAWRQAATEGLEEGQIDLRTWWRQLDDPVLWELVQRAGAGNLDLKIAAARIQQARAILGTVEPDLWPTIDAFGNFDVQRLGGGGFTDSFAGETFDTWGVGVDFEWELDVWGRIRRTIESAEAEVGAQVEAYRDVLVLLYAEIGLEYVELRTLQARIDFAETNAELQRGSVQLTRDRVNAQISPELDVRQAELNLAGTEAGIPALRQRLLASAHRLAVLVGEHPDALYPLLEQSVELPEVPEGVDSGLPAELVRRRPDIRASERALHAQTAQVGAAEALLYPSFALGGRLGLSAADPGDLFDSDALNYGLSFPVRFNLFNRKRLNSNVLLQEQRTQELLLVYERTVLAALAEVETSLVALARERERRGFLEQAVAAAERSVELVRAQYLSDLTNFQNVLDMQRTLAAQQDSLAESRGRVIQNLILLYKALGGGWGGQAEERELSERGGGEADRAEAPVEADGAGAAGEAAAAAEASAAAG